MKTIVELYEDSNTDQIVNKYARMNYLDRDDLKQEVFLGILKEYTEGFNLDGYVKKIAMRLKRSEQRESSNALPFDERFLNPGSDDIHETWNYYFGDDDYADVKSNAGHDTYWRGCSPEMNERETRAYKKS